MSISRNEGRRNSDFIFLLFSSMTVSFGRLSAARTAAEGRKRIARGSCAWASRGQRRGSPPHGGVEGLAIAATGEQANSKCHDDPLPRSDACVKCTPSESYWDGVVLTHRARVPASIAARGRFLFVRRRPFLGKSFLFCIDFPHCSVRAGRRWRTYNSGGEQAT